MHGPHAASRSRKSKIPTVPSPSTSARYSTGRPTGRSSTRRTGSITSLAPSLGFATTRRSSPARSTTSGRPTARDWRTAAFRFTLPRRCSATRRSRRPPNTISMLTRTPRTLSGLRLPGRTPVTIQWLASGSRRNRRPRDAINRVHAAESNTRDRTRTCNLRFRRPDDTRPYRVLRAVKAEVL